MARQPYPLEALRRLRNEQAEALAQDLARQGARSQRAGATLVARENARREHAVRTAEVLRVEQRRLGEGGVYGTDLLRVAEFERAARAQAELLQQAEADARKALADEQAVEQKLRAEQTAREAEAKLVRNHEASFRQHQADLQQKAEEEAALEQWNARRH